ncbi:MAG: twin transmembrane helix small protein [Henriciella sp.]
MPLSILQISFIIALAALVIVLALGLANIVRTDPGQASRSNKLMRLRVLAQAVVIGVLVLIGLAVGAIGS